MQKLQVIDYLRGFSIFTIALMHLLMGAHLNSFWGSAIMLGGAGVHVFILCSGFGLYYSYLNRPIGYFSFLHKRFGKIYLPYAIAIFFYAILNGFITDNNNLSINEIASHLFLYKMFNSTLNISICYPFWFISTIFQFYVSWPLIIKLVEINKGLWISLIISSSWWILVSYLGYEDYRSWGSCFLQYLWEFVLGMYLAKIYKSNMCSENFILKKIKFEYLLLSALVGLALTGFMGKMGGILKLFNDIPSLVGYLSLLLIIYKFRLKLVNSFFCWSNKFSYELYLLHALAYGIIKYILPVNHPIILVFLISFVFAYIIAFLYEKLLRVIKVK